MSTPPVIFSARVQSQVADANLGTKGLNALFGVLNPSREGLRVPPLGRGRVDLNSVYIKFDGGFCRIY
jgi:hypothetical protein